MTFFDHLLILILFLVQPVFGRYNFVSELKRIASGHSPDRICLYWQTIGVQWLFLSVLLAVWIIGDRSFEMLGFVPPSGTGFWLGTSAVAVGTLLVLLSGKRIGSLAQAERDEHRESFGNLGYFLPQSNEELAAFYQLSITAGIVEEIVYRGFVLWYLQLFMGIWPAVAVSSIAFGLAHSYQGLGGMLRTGLVAAVLGTLFAISGSIWLPIVAHILLDILQGRQIREIYRDLPAAVRAP